jgi:biotin carboxylase
VPCLWRCRWRLRLTGLDVDVVATLAPPDQAVLSARPDTAPRVLLVAPPNSYRTAAYVQSARELGISLVVASEGEYSLVPEVADGVHVPLRSAAALERLLGEGRRRGVDAVVATDDSTVELASQVAEGLGLRHNPVASARISRRKDLARGAMARAGLPTPGYRLVDLTRPLGPQIAGLGYPCVVKPLAFSASRGVIRVDAPAALLAACERVRPLLQEAASPEEREHLLVEDFLPGAEVALEGMLDQGQLRVLAVFDKPDPLDGPFFEETYYVTPSRLSPAVQATVRRRVEEACRAYGLRVGPVHAELRVKGEEAWPLEVASRTIGGQCARLLGLGTGRTLESLVLAQAVGRPLTLHADAGAAGVLMIPIPRAGILRRVEGVLDATGVPYIEDVEISIREGYELVPLPEGSSYLGFVFARAPTPELAEQALRQAHACLNIVTAPLWKVLPGAEQGR